ncbi:serine hydrolase [Nonomuraea rubra]
MPLTLLASSGVHQPTPAPMPIPFSPVAIASAPEPAPVKEPSQKRRPSYRKGLTRSLDRYLDDLPGDLSVQVRELSSGLSYSYNRSLRTATASIVKVNIVAALLLRAQRERRGLTGWEKRAAAQAIKISDNDAASRLWAAIGGASGLAAANRKLGLRDTRPGPGGAWGSTTTSAADQVRLLNAMVAAKSPLSPKHRRYVLELMADVTPEQSWGVSAAGGRAEVKNGWLPRQRDGGRWTVNSIGRVRERGRTYLIAVISRRHRSLGAGIKAVEHVSKLVAKSIGKAAKK